MLIVDDICDGGKTFELLAEQLYSNGAEEVNLFVTHGLFTKGLRPLKNAGIKRIFTNKGEAIQMADGGFGFRKTENRSPSTDAEGAVTKKFDPYDHSILD